MIVTSAHKHQPGLPGHHNNSGGGLGMTGTARGRIQSQARWLLRDGWTKQNRTHGVDLQKLEGALYPLRLTFIPGGGIILTCSLIISDLGGPRLFISSPLRRDAAGAELPGHDLVRFRVAFDVTDPTMKTSSFWVGGLGAGTACSGFLLGPWNRHRLVAGPACCSIAWTLGRILLLRLDCHWGASGRWSLGRWSRPCWRWTTTAYRHGDRLLVTLVDFGWLGTFPGVAGGPPGSVDLGRLDWR